MEESKRPSRNVFKPLRYRDSVEDSEEVEIPAKKKSTTKMMKCVSKFLKQMINETNS